MILGTHGILTDSYGQVLLIRRDDLPVWTLPGGRPGPAELPPAAAAREIEEETGLKALPVRLAGMYFWDAGRRDELHFVFRCLLRGGELRPSAESPTVAYWPADRLPAATLAVTRELLARSLRHAGGRPFWGRQRMPAWLRLYLGTLGRLYYRRLDAGRRRRGEPPYQPPRVWTAGAFVALPDEQGRLLWVQRVDSGAWNLPGGLVEPGEAPWEAAAREAREETGLEVAPSDLSGVYLKPDKGQIVFNFVGRATAGQLTTGPESDAFAYFAPGSEPAGSLAKQRQRAADALAERDTPFFRLQAG
ncbi:MAG: NUDIX hydrolase [Candidatus Promineifilaceae bacterium]